MERKILYKEWLRDVSSYSEMNIEGYFETWGLALYETSENFCTYTVAIIRDISGNVLQIDPTHLKFV